LHVLSWGNAAEGAVEVPAGMWVDIVEQIGAQAGFWDQYLTNAWLFSKAGDDSNSSLEVFMSRSGPNS
jgi:hypothetical protein